MSITVVEGHLSRIEYDENTQIRALEVETPDGTYRITISPWTNPFPDLRELPTVIEPIGDNRPEIKIYRPTRSQDYRL